MEDDEVVVDDADPVVEQSVEVEAEEVEVVEEIDPLTEAIQRAEAAEKEITYRDAEIQNVRKRLMSEKAIAIQSMASMEGHWLPSSKAIHRL